MFFQGKGHCSSTLPKTNVFPPLLLGWQRLNGQQLADRLQLSPASKGLPARIYSSTKRSTFRLLTCQVVTDIAFQLVAQHSKSISLKERTAKQLLVLSDLLEGRVNNIIGINYLWGQVFEYSTDATWRRMVHVLTRLIGRPKKTKIATHCTVERIRNV